LSLVIVSKGLLKKAPCLADLVLRRFGRHDGIQETDTMRILRGLSSRLLPCGCLAGIYETYDGVVVGILDARGQACTDPEHLPESVIPIPLPDPVPAKGV
jgi:hypothetical protein